MSTTSSATTVVDDAGDAPDVPVFKCRLCPYVLVTSEQKQEHLKVHPSTSPLDELTLFRPVSPLRLLPQQRTPEERAAVKAKLEAKRAAFRSKKKGKARKIRPKKTYKPPCPLNEWPMGLGA